jgi:hypothetical protein
MCHAISSRRDIERASHRHKRQPVSSAGVVNAGAARGARSEPKAESIDDAEHDARIVTPVVGPLLSK